MNSQVQHLFSAIRPLLALLLVHVLSACSLTLDLNASQALNMRMQSTPSGGATSISELMEVAIFQLKQVPEDKQRELVMKLESEWLQHRSQMPIYRAKGSFPASLAPFLSYPPTVLEIKRPSEIFVLNPGEHYMKDIPLRTSTSHLLVMALGSRLGLRSVQLFDVDATTGTITICFHQYDVYRYDRDHAWPCPQRPSMQ